MEMSKKGREATGFQQDTGTPDEVYDLVSVLYHALQAAETCELYIDDAESDDDVRRFFKEVQMLERQIADRAKKLLGPAFSGRKAA